MEASLRIEMPRSFKPVEHLSAEDMRARLQSSNTAKQFGFELAGAESGRVVLRMRVDARHLQVHNVVHGGVLASLADTAGGLATYMAYPRGVRVATVEMKINYLEAVEGGTVEADARVLRHGKHIAVVDCDVRDENRRLVGKALMTFFVGPFEKNRKKRRR
jgi:1,4-dihydroxy-2-naphthoyl-CoA hydrolase